jgi:hypothetical protein
LKGWRGSISKDDITGNGPRGEGLPGQGQGAGRGALAAVLTGIDVVGSHQGTDTIEMAFNPLTHGQRKHRALSDGMDAVAKALEELKETVRFLREKGLKAKPLPSQPQEFQDFPGVFTILLRGLGPPAITAGPWPATHQGDAISPHLKRLEEEGLTDPTRTWDADHLDLVGDGRGRILKGLKGRVRPPVTKEEDHISF